MPHPDSTHIESFNLPGGALTFDLIAHQAQFRHRLLPLGPLEFSLLLHLARQRGQPVSYAALLHEVWGYAPDGPLHQLKSCIKRLRHAIEPDPHRPRYVLNVRGYGYLLVVNVDEASPKI